MAGHSKWANIQHRKGKQDGIRSKMFSKLSKEITVAAKMGDPDPDKNPRLRLAVKAAKAVSMPKGVAVVIINSNFKRTLVGSEYNTRREQCETGARFFQQPALRDVTLQEFNAVAHELDPVVAKRVRHVLTENARTVEAAAALEKGDLLRMGELMAESHASMRDDFEITVPQIDTLVDIVKVTIGDKGGVRMTGGGFGGCIVALVPEDLVDTVQQAVAKEYEAKTGIKETFYVCKPSQGAGQC